MDRKLKILQVNKAYYPHVGGIESLVRQYSEELSQRPDTEVKVLVCGTKEAEVSVKKSTEWT